MLTPPCFLPFPHIIKQFSNCFQFLSHRLFSLTLHDEDEDEDEEEEEKKTKRHKLNPNPNRRRLNLSISMEPLSRPPHGRKHSTATSASSSSFSINNRYGDVMISRGDKAKFQPHEYAEIFSVSSSIPVLDLSGLNGPACPGGCRSSELDYSNIFGGPKDGDVAVCHAQLFNGVLKKHKTR